MVSRYLDHVEVVQSITFIHCTIESILTNLGEQEAAGVREVRLKLQKVGDKPSEDSGPATVWWWETCWSKTAHLMERMHDTILCLPQWRKKHSVCYPSWVWRQQVPYLGIHFPPADKMKQMPADFVGRSGLWNKDPWHLGCITWQRYRQWERSCVSCFFFFHIFLLVGG